MRQTLLDWRGGLVAIKTIQGDTWEGLLEKIDGEIAIVNVQSKGKFAVRIDHITLAVQISSIAIAKELRIN